jgi:hypothetical protein
VATNDLRPYLLCDEPTRMDDGLCDRCAAEGEAENREPETCPGCTADLGDPDARHDADCSEMARGDVEGEPTYAELEGGEPAATSGHGLCENCGAECVGAMCKPCNDARVRAEMR